MHGNNRKKIIRISMIAVAAAAAIFAVLYYAGAFLPGYTVWHELSVGGDDDASPDIIELKDRSVKVYEDGKVIFRSPAFCRVSNMIYSDINRDGEKELVLLNFNIGEFGKHRPFWVKFDPPVYRQHIYIYKYLAGEKTVRPIWMASDIGVKASDFDLIGDDVIRITDNRGEETNWMWISFGLRCVD